MKRNVDALFGLQWGDEGKGKIHEALLYSNEYDIGARFQGGPNAGHTIMVDGKPYVLHIIPSGIFHPTVKNFIGSGVVVDPVILQDEINNLIATLHINPCERLFISRKASLILPTHRILDAVYESANGGKIGSTLKGIGPTYTDKTARNGIRFCDINTTDFRKLYDELKSQHRRIAESLGFDIGSFKIGDDDLASFEKKWFAAINLISQNIPIIDGEYWLNGLINDGKKVLVEGAQGTMLDVNFGTYPFVTSSITTIGGVCSSLGIPASAINRVFGISKLYCTRVGAGPFPTELFDETGELLRKKGKEFGATTGRARRCGWLDLVQLKYACMINGVTDIIITKADILDDFKEIRVCTAYQIGNQVTKRVPDDLSKVHPIYTTLPWSKITDDNRENLNSLIELVNEYVAPAKVSYVSIGPGQKDMFAV